MEAAPQGWGGACSDDGKMEVQERETRVCDAGTTFLSGGVIGKPGGRYHYERSDLGRAPR